MAEHFRRFAESVRETFFASSEDPLVVEIGSNDGIMLQNFANAGIRHLGIEPSANVAQAAREKGIETISEFFDEKVAQRIVAEKGQADAFLAANVMCHIPYMHSVMAGIKTLLKPKGAAGVRGSVPRRHHREDVVRPDLRRARVLLLGHLDRVPGEPARARGHRRDPAARSRRLDALRDRPQGRAPRVQNVRRQKAFEDQLGLHDPETYRKFAKSVAQSKTDLLQLLNDLKRQGQRVGAYGATSKSTTVTNYCGIGPDLVEFISDTTPIKQGKFSPGTHIPVVPHETFAKNPPSHTLLFAWNHAEEILAKEQQYRANGGKFLLYVPKVRTL